MTIQSVDILPIMFKENFIRGSIETGTNYDERLQRIKEASSILANTIEPNFPEITLPEKLIKEKTGSGTFTYLANMVIRPLNNSVKSLITSAVNQETSGIKLPNGSTMKTFFSDKTYGYGFTQGLTSILATTMVLSQRRNEPEVESDAAVNAYETKISNLSQTFYNHFFAENRNMAKAREKTIELNNEYGRSYKPLALNYEQSTKQLDEQFTLTCPVEVDAISGNLVATFDNDFSHLLFRQYESQVKECLTETGVSHWTTTTEMNRSSSVIIAYNDELARVPDLLLGQVMENNKEIQLKFHHPHFKLEENDYRHLARASMLVDKDNVDAVRASLNIKNENAFEKPLRHTFAAVTNVTFNYTESSIVSMMKSTKELENWMQLVDPS